MNPKNLLYGIPAAGALIGVITVCSYSGLDFTPVIVPGAVGFVLLLVGACYLSKSICQRMRQTALAPQHQFGETADSSEEVVVAPTPSLSLEQWWYLHEGQKNGPVAVEQIKGLGANTLVWKTGMADWTRVAQIFPLTSHPPIPVEEISQMAVWFWSFSPLWLLLVPRITLIELGQLGIFGVSFAINSIFYAWDLHLIRKSGRENDFWGWYWIFVPVYLFVRASKLKVSYVYAFVWLIMSLLIRTHIQMKKILFLEPDVVLWLADHFVGQHKLRGVILPGPRRAVHRLRGITFRDVVQNHGSLGPPVLENTWQRTPWKAVSALAWYSGWPSC